MAETCEYPTCTCGHMTDRGNGWRERWLDVTPGPVGWRFCPHCGDLLGDGTTTPPATPEQRRDAEAMAALRAAAEPGEAQGGGAPWAIPADGIAPGVRVSDMTAPPTQDPDATDSLADLERRVKDADRAASERAERVAAAQAAIEAWGCAWREQTEQPTLEAWPPMTARAVSVDRPRGHIADADDWRQLAKKLIAMEAAPYRARIEAAGYTLILRYPADPDEMPVQVQAPGREMCFGDLGGYPTPEACERAAQWAEARTAAPAPVPAEGIAPGAAVSDRTDAPEEAHLPQAAAPTPSDADADADLARKLACVDALADRLKLPPILRLTMQARMRAGHEAHAGQDLFARDLREEGRGEAVDLLNYTACQEDATPDDLQAAHLAASAWALLGGDAEGAEATPEPAQDRTCHTCAHLHTIRIGCRHPDGTGEQYEQTAHDGADCPLHEAAP